MKKKLARMLALVLAAAMTFSLAACGGKKEQGEQKEKDKNKEQTTAQKTGFAWVPEYLKLDTEQNFYDPVVSGEYLYYEKYEWNEETETSKISIASFSLTDGSAGPEIVISQPEPEKEGEGEEGEEGEKGEGKVRASDNRDISSFMFDMDGNLVTIETVYHWNEETGGSSQEYYLCKYSAQGEKLSEQDFSDVMEKDENNSYVRDVCMDGEGRVYMLCDTLLRLFNAEGNYDGDVTIGDSYIQGIGQGKDGKVYIAYDSMESNSTILQVIDYEGKKLGQTYKDFIRSNSNSLVTGVEKDFLGNDGSTVYEYDIATQTAEKLLDWLDCDVYGNYVNYLKVLEDGRILAVSNNWEKNESELILLTRKPVSEVPEKIHLTIGMLHEDSRIYSSAVNFNKSSDKYHIDIKSYYDYNDIVYSGDTSNYEEVMNDALTRMNNDITSDNCPDLLSVNGINVQKYVPKGVFEDLGAYLDNSSKLKRDEFFENILEAYTYDGVLVAIPKSFSLETMSGKASQVGTEPGWTLAEMLAYGDAHPDALLLGNSTKESALTTMLRFSQGNFVDWETGKCSFDNETFENILEFANKFPKDWEYNEDEPSTPTKIARGEVLLNTVSIYDFNSIQVEDAIFENDLTFIGYPNEKGEGGTYLRTEAGIAITSKCSEKEGAWSFMESWLCEEDGRYSWGFPSNKNNYAKRRAEAIKVEYVLDENGEKVLDENGEPIIENSGGGIGYGDDWEYTYHVPTEEEVKRLDELIQSARPVMDSDTQIMNIISEEAQAFFSGQKSAKDVAGVIQSRVQVYVNENM